MVGALTLSFHGTLQWFSVRAIRLELSMGNNKSFINNVISFAVILGKSSDEISEIASLYWRNISDLDFNFVRANQGAKFGDLLPYS